MYLGRMKKMDHNAIEEIVSDHLFYEIDEINKKAWDIRRSDLRTSWKLANDAERDSIINSYQQGVAESLRTLGYCLWRFGDYSQSLEKSMLALDIFRDLKDKKGEADTLNSIGAVYMYQGDNENRLKCNLLCLQLRAEIKDLEGVAGSENNIGETYMEMGNFEEANNWFDKCLKNPNASIQNLSWVHHNVGIIFYRTHQLEKSIKAFKQSLELSDSVNYEVLSIASRLQISLALIEVDVFSKEINNHLNQALTNALAIGIKEDVHKIYLTFSQLSEKRGDLPQAFNWYKKYHKAYEDLFNENSNQKINNIQTQYEIEKARQEIEFEHTKQLELKQFIDKISIQNNEILQKNQEITDSIKYASRIQYASLTTNGYIKRNSPFDFFIYYKPKDIVSGDFYWAIKKDTKFFIAVCDSTGHGVPGAFMSLLNISFLNEAINEKNITEPNLIFDYVRQSLIENLSDEEQQDGMDGALLCIDMSTNLITYAAAYNAPVIIRDKQIMINPADKMPIGKGIKVEPFNKYTLDYKIGDCVYLLTDGFADQFGGPKGKKYKYKQVRNLMSENFEIPINEQAFKFSKSFDLWRGNQEQVDDVTLLGMKIT